MITVSWNVREHLRSALKALFASDGRVSFEVLVADNASKDGTADMLREFEQKHEYARVLYNQSNVGFARANNQAIELSRGRYILLLNPDMRVFPDTLSRMVRWMDENPSAAVAGAHLQDERGTTVQSVRRFPGLRDQLLTVLKVPHIFPGVLDSYIMRGFDYERAARVDSVRGSFFMMRRCALAIGGLDERFFVWFEEVDFCKRLRGAGMEVWYTPAALCVDLVGRSFAQLSGTRKQSLFLQSMYRYFSKWGDWRHRAAMFLVIPFGMALAAVFSVFSRR